ncbi:ABC transporter ATP-binding protein [Natronobacterium gregoryi]|uniref:Cobalamin import ATP-binding protein BtuD n=2 Tax=Natronobacterium gregoryi TaxID=44930 RepID=L0AE83_NATGS|nr:ABC transporter ATP-binding protein [Natronobacterium gregoryi]AFZ72213.1 ABC-type cobalamin/Fe3+-siderophore transport system, ATPase component [Natronobacterium gregoryi SP2]ELY62387.1 ABC transporter [Natronobacterium gregoryi SP2]PLK20163.1 ABC transporter ATP-binding protein [Natronobacterium gregoryi SP2]SFJ28218.1 iron complex transport system ATP-binding protein [Natronobacterium gregoryi]
MRLDVCDVEFAYDSDPVLDGVDLELERGQLLGIVGPNGSGKSTLLRCLNRIIEPDSGAVLVDGENVDELSREGIARRMGYVPQQEDATFPSTVFDTILMGRKPHVQWRPTDDDRATVTDVIERLDLEPFALRSLDELSGGQQQKVLIGRALVQEATVLLLDEPTSNLDVRHQLEVLDVVREEIDDGMAAVVAIHDLNLATRYCDRLAMLHDDRIVAAGGPEILTPETIRDVYGVDATVTSHDGRRIVIPERPLSRSEDDGRGAESERRDGR